MAVNKLLDRMREAVETSGTPGRVGNTPTNERCPPINTGKKGTPPKFDMEPKNQTLEKEIPFGNHHFQVPCLTLGV